MIHDYKNHDRNGRELLEAGGWWGQAEGRTPVLMDCVVGLLAILKPLLKYEQIFCINNVPMVQYTNGLCGPFGTTNLTHSHVEPMLPHATRCKMFKQYSRPCRIQDLMRNSLCSQDQFVIFEDHSTHKITSSCEKET